MIQLKTKARYKAVRIWFYVMVDEELCDPFVGLSTFRGKSGPWHTAGLPALSTPKVDELRDESNLAEILHFVRTQTSTYMEGSPS